VGPAAETPPTRTGGRVTLVSPADKQELTAGRVTHAGTGACGAAGGSAGGVREAAESPQHRVSPPESRLYDGSTPPESRPYPA